MFGAIKSSLWNAAVLTTEFVTSLVATDGFNAKTKTKYQIKVLTADVPAGVGASVLISQLAFNNLIIGKSYRISLNVFMSQSGGGGSSVHIKNGVVNLGVARRFAAATSSNSTHAFSRIFIATDTNITFTITDVTTATASVIHSASLEASFSQLEELPNHEVTTQFT